MNCTVFSACPHGVEAVSVIVEVDVRPNNLRVSIVGLPDAATRESKDRLVPAITNSGFALASDDITINLAPANLRKEGTGFDLAMAVGILVSKGILLRDKVEGLMFLGELALDGGLRPVRGVLAAAECAMRQGFRGLVLPQANLAEAQLIKGLTIWPLQSLAQWVGVMRGRVELEPVIGNGVVPCDREPTQDQVDFSFIKGQSGVKRALEIAAAGKHNILMFGPPGSGKSMLGRAIATILPPLNATEVIEVTRISSCVGRLEGGQAILERPFRQPHHTASPVAMVGGGTNPRPGEVSQAHLGVLFLDEFPEFPRAVLEVLRQPLEDRKVTVSRAADKVTFPADFMLVAAMNPCPCGYRGDPRGACQCPEYRVEQYLSRLSGPLLDRIDIHIEVPALTIATLRRLPPAETSATVRARVAQARARQEARYGLGTTTNASMTTTQMERHCCLPVDMADWLGHKVDRQGCSKRVHDKILRVARTIADLVGREAIAREDILEALSYRQLDIRHKLLAAAEVP